MYDMYGNVIWIVPQLKRDLTAVEVKYLSDKLVGQIIMIFIGININLNGADDPMIWSETDIQMIFDEQHDDEPFIASHHRKLLLLKQI